jgi:hypothetical protein
MNEPAAPELIEVVGLEAFYGGVASCMAWISA